MIARMIIVLGSSLFLSGVVLAPVALIAYATGARPRLHLLARMVAWGACFLVSVAYVAQLVSV